MTSESKKKNWRNKLHELIFESDTRTGKVFDIVLMTCILVSVLIVMLDSVASYNQQYGKLFLQLEWFFTGIFTIEYILRLVSVKQPKAYAYSFFGVIDLLAILPTYLSLILPGTQILLVIRFLRVLRIFRVLKFTQYLKEIDQLNEAIVASKRKILVFMFTVISLTVIVGSLMYLIEGTENGYTSIPRSIYWAVVTLTTVGYGDISPQTPLGQFFAIIIMIAGYGIIAVPTGIVSAELTKKASLKISTQVCRNCGFEDHDIDALFCKKCGDEIT
jgi:voltage-gated potassium channel